MKIISIMLILLLAITSINAFEHRHIYRNCVAEEEKKGDKFAYLNYAIHNDYTNQYEDLAVCRNSVETKDNFFDEMKSLESWKNKTLDIGKYFEEKELICFYDYVGEQYKFIKGIDY